MLHAIVPQATFPTSVFQSLSIIPLQHYKLCELSSSALGMFPAQGIGTFIFSAQNVLPPT